MANFVVEKYELMVVLKNHLILNLSKYIVKV